MCLKNKDRTSTNSELLSDHTLLSFLRNIMASWRIHFWMDRELDWWNIRSKMLCTYWCVFIPVRRLSGATLRGSVSVTFTRFVLGLVSCVGVRDEPALVLLWHFSCAQPIAAQWMSSRRKCPLCILPHSITVSQLRYRGAGTVCFPSDFHVVWVPAFKSETLHATLGRFTVCPITKNPLCCWHEMGGACLTCAWSDHELSFPPEPSPPLSLQLKPNTCDITHAVIGYWLAGPAHTAAGCSLRFPPRRDQQLWPALPATRSRSALRSITLLHSSEASTCGWPQQLHTSRRLSTRHACRGIVLWALWRNYSVTSEVQTLKAASTNSPQDTCFLHGAWCR